MLHQLQSLPIAVVFGLEGRPSPVHEGVPAPICPCTYPVPSALGRSAVTRQLHGRGQAALAGTEPAAPRDRDEQQQRKAAPIALLLKLDEQL